MSPSNKTTQRTIAVLAALVVVAVIIVALIIEWLEGVVDGAPLW